VSRCPILEEVKREIERLKEEVKALHAATFKQCPNCHSKLTERETESEKLLVCPKCGYAHAVYYKGV